MVKNKRTYKFAKDHSHDMSYENEITYDKLIFLKAISNVIKSGMDIVGVTVPEKM